MAELMGYPHVQTTMMYVDGVRKQKIEATVRLQAYIEATRRAKQLQEEREARLETERRRAGMPIREYEERFLQNAPHVAEDENLPFWSSHLLSIMCARSSAG